MTCKDCIHHDLCFDNGTLFINYAKGKEKENAEIYCPFKKFKNKADFVEVVRCYQCKHHMTTSDIQVYYCKERSLYTDKQGFCHCGERE